MGMRITSLLAMALCLAPVSTLAVAAEAVPAAAPPAAWWEGFADPVLSSLEQRALAQNLDLAMTAQQVMTARAALRIAGAKGLPTVGASASYDREQASAQGILSLLGTQSPSTTSASGADPFGSTAATGTGGPAFNLYQAGIDASWEIDLWGKARAARRAARADMLAAAYGHDAAALALGAEVARSYLALRGLEQTIAITREGIDVVSRGFEIARRRESEGAVSHMDGAQAQADLQAYRARLPELEQQRQVLANALALLTGQMPHTLDALLAGNHPTTVWQNAVPDSLPADIARQRPDIAAAEASLQRVHLSPTVQKVGSNSPVGTVLGTNPRAGTTWPQTKTVAILVAGGPPVPNFVGQNIAAAQQWAQAHGVNLQQQQDQNSTQPQGTITGQQPAPGSVYLGLIAIFPLIALDAVGVGQQFPFSGVSLLIMVGVGLDTVKQIESQLQQRNYEGFLR